MRLPWCAFLSALSLRCVRSYPEFPSGFRDQASDMTRRSQYEFRLWVRFFWYGRLQTTPASLHKTIEDFAFKKCYHFFFVTIATTPR
uniref:Putative secreted protein n=1 Tax=Ixodes ricinus TaxID=34613 RepID=A0A6B0TZI8_IXORI